MIICFLCLFLLYFSTLIIKVISISLITFYFNLILKHRPTLSPRLLSALLLTFKYLFSIYDRAQ